MEKTTSSDLSALPEVAKNLLSCMEKLGISTRTVCHQAVFTVAESKLLRGEIPGGHCKSLLLKSRKGELFLVLLEETKRLDTTRLSKMLGIARMSFASAEVLEKKMGVAPGTATPFAVINNIENDVCVVIDSALSNFPIVNFHPLTNTASTAVSISDLKAFIEHCGNRWLEVDAPSNE